MRRRIVVLLVSAVMAVALWAATAAPGFAQDGTLLGANPHASCVGKAHSTINQLLPGNPGAFHKLVAHEGRNGEVMSNFSHFGTPGNPSRTVAGVLVGIEDGWLIICIGH